MGKKEKHIYLEAITRRYRRSSRANKGVILDEFCSVCGYSRKYAIRILNHPPQPASSGHVGRKAIYRDDAFLTALKRIWFASDQMCSKRLVEVIGLWLPFYQTHYGPLSAENKRKLLMISASSIDRALHPVRVKYGKGRCTTRPGTLLRNQIPVRTHHWDVTQPGFVEADTVAHCGNSIAGEYVWSLTFTDILTTWTENRATWGKGSIGVLDQIKDIEKQVPFELKGFHCDSGTEFLNHHLLRYFTDRPRVVSFTRSRPYKKNDNAHVEQKNWSHVRQLLGYDRLDRRELIPLINDLYANEWSLYQNHFCPTLKLVEKTRINSRYRKKYDKPKTPYQRVMESKHIDGLTRQKLKTVHLSLDPFKLKADIEHKIRRIFQQVKVTSNVRQRI
jgi:hypothetical protein